MTNEPKYVKVEIVGHKFTEYKRTVRVLMSEYEQIENMSYGERLKVLTDLCLVHLRPEDAVPDTEDFEDAELELVPNIFSTNMKSV
jgi:hypothetical protein